MKKFNKGSFSLSKETIYLDVDDVLIDSRFAAIEIINKCHGLSKTVEDIKDWGFRSVYGGMTSEELDDIFSCEEFWANVQINPVIEKALDTWLLDRFNCVLVTKGSDRNLENKYNMLFNSNDPRFEVISKNKDKIGFYGLNRDESKSKIYMFTGIQIDDYYPNLKDTDASIKILLKNGMNTKYNSMLACADNLENLYICNTMEEVLEILKFITVDDRFIDELEEFDFEKDYLAG